MSRTSTLSSSQVAFLCVAQSLLTRPKHRKKRHLQPIITSFEQKLQLLDAAVIPKSCLMLERSPPNFFLCVNWELWKINFCLSRGDSQDRLSFEERKSSRSILRIVFAFIPKSESFVPVKKKVRYRYQTLSLCFSVIAAGEKTVSATQSQASQSKNNATCSGLLLILLHRWSEEFCSLLKSWLLTAENSTTFLARKSTKQRGYVGFNFWILFKLTDTFVKVIFNQSCYLRRTKNR